MIRYDSPSPNHSSFSSVFCWFSQGKRACCRHRILPVRDPFTSSRGSSSIDGHIVHLQTCRAAPGTIECGGFLVVCQRLWQKESKMFVFVFEARYGKLHPAFCIAKDLQSQHSSQKKKRIFRLQVDSIESIVVLIGFRHTKWRELHKCVRVLFREVVSKRYVPSRASIYFLTAIYSSLVLWVYKQKEINKFTVWVQTIDQLHAHHKGQAIFQKKKRSTKSYQFVMDAFAVDIASGPTCPRSSPIRPMFTVSISVTVCVRAIRTKLANHRTGDIFPGVYWSQVIKQRDTDAVSEAACFPHRVRPSELFETPNVLSAPQERAPVRQPNVSTIVDYSD
jgi:hypothetical protein